MNHLGMKTLEKKDMSNKELVTVLEIGKFESDNNYPAEGAMWDRALSLTEKYELLDHIDNKYSAVSFALMDLPRDEAEKLPSVKGAQAISEILKRGAELEAAMKKGKKS